MYLVSARLPLKGVFQRKVNPLLATSTTFTSKGASGTSSTRRRELNLAGPNAFRASQLKDPESQREADGAVNSDIKPSDVSDVTTLYLKVE